MPQIHLSVFCFDVNKSERRFFSFFFYRIFSYSKPVEFITSMTDLLSSLTISILELRTIFRFFFVRFVSPVAAEAIRAYQMWCDCVMQTTIHNHNSLTNQRTRKDVENVRKCEMRDAVLFHHLQLCQHNWHTEQRNRRRKRKGRKTQKENWKNRAKKK